jgi:hypothetical protein
VFPVSRTKFDIFRHSSKLGKGLDCTFVIALLDILETGFYYLCDASGLIVLLRDK